MHNPTNRLCPRSRDLEASCRCTTAVSSVVEEPRLIRGPMEVREINTDHVLLASKAVGLLAEIVQDATPAQTSNDWLVADRLVVAARKLLAKTKP